MIADRSLKNGRTLIYRIPGLVRATHWVIALALLVLLLSGLQIFNAHPALYWGDVSDFKHPFLEVGARDGGEGAARGFVRLGPFRAGTTGFLGVVDDGAGQPEARAFPRWLTLPKDQDLASGRRWHFFFAWVLTLSLAAYFIANFIRRRFRRDLLPSRNELRGIVRSVWEHLRFRVPEGEEARHYNILQKLAYLSIMFGIIPLVIVTGLAMSPAMDAAFPWLPQVLGGRQTARSLHFFGTAVLVLFFAVHILMILVAGPANELRSIITGWFAIGEPSRGIAKERPNDESR
jgi:thiosulfate reductase cytochrome b subunit